ncbi:MAG: very short patch repair endonuclease [Thaumarchaeota archaeon]|nr:very short patch repair endonuclease [Nitrososphaerota archaeon]
MRSNKRSGTKPELVLSGLLKKKILQNHLPGSPDFVFPRTKLAIFLNGCFWHRCPIHAKALPNTNAPFWRRKFERNAERDRLNREELESMGWRVLEIWEHDVKERPRETAARIKAAVRESYPISSRTSKSKTARVS